MAKKRKTVLWVRRGDGPWKPSGTGVALLCVIVLLSVGMLIRSGHKDSASTSVDAGIRLSEIVSDNISSYVAADGSMPDWIEIENAGSETVSLKNYALMADSNVGKLFVFPDVSLAPGEYMIVLADGTDVTVKNGELHAPFRLAASGGETLYLMDASNTVIDSVDLIEVQAGSSYERGADGEWQISTMPTPGEQNMITQTTEERTAAIELTAGEVEITEVMSANTLYAPYMDYIELHNISDSAVDLAGWWLSDDAAKPLKWQFPSVTLDAGAYMLVYCSGTSDTSDTSALQTDFRLSRSGESICLSNASGDAVSLVETPALEKNQAYSCLNGSWTSKNAPTPGAANDDTATASLTTAGTLMISEIMAAPTTETCDWIEICNAGTQAVDLSGCGLSDNSGRPRKWQFPQGTTIQPGEYMTVCCSSSGDTTINGMANTGFALSAEGGYTVVLATAEGTILDSVYVPKQYDGISYGRTQLGSRLYYFASGTPGTANTANSYVGRAEAPTYSVEGSLHKSGDSFEVSMSVPAGFSIYYTLDCTDPTESSTLYTAPITVSSTTILRTRVYATGYLPSFVDTQSYLYDVDNDGKAYIVSLVADPANLTGEDGLITNYEKRMEKEGHVEIFTVDGEKVISQGCGLSLHGADSRKLTIKSFNVIARNAYGENRLNYPLFSERDYTSYQSILLRPSGEDYKMSFMRDTLLSSLMKDTSVLYQKWELAVCYINGRYYTFYYMRERINKHSICQFEGWEGMEDDIDLVEGNSSAVLGSNKTFAEMLEYVTTNDMTTDAAYEYIDSRIDIQNYIEYMSIEIFTGNTDLLNVRRYRNAKADGKWRWVLFDLDWAFYNDTDSIGKWLTPGGTGAGKRTDNTFFIACMKNPTFRDRFLTYFGQQLATTFSSENVVARINERYELIKNLLAPVHEKLGMSESDYARRLRKIVRYAETRPTKLLDFFRNALSFTSEEWQRYFGDAINVINAYTPTIEQEEDE